MKVALYKFFTVLLWLTIIPSAYLFVISIKLLVTDYQLLVEVAGKILPFFYPVFFSIPLLLIWLIRSYFGSQLQVRKYLSERRHQRAIREFKRKLKQNKEFQYWAFISYSSKDIKWAKWLHRSLEYYRVPRKLVGQQMPSGDPTPKRFHPIFRDREDLPASSDIGKELEQVLAASRFLIVVASPNSAASLWVNREIEFFIRLGKIDQIFTIIIDGEPNNEHGMECFAPALKNTSPLAADARHHGDGKTNAKLKLLAGMLGIGFDTLKHRDMRRWIFRLSVTLSISIIITILVVGLGWYAETQRKNAVAADMTSIMTMLTGDDLAEFLLFDLREQFEKMGKDDFGTISRARKLADKYFEDIKKMWPEFGDVRANSIHRILEKRFSVGSEYLRKNQPAEALAAYHSFLRILEYYYDDTGDIKTYNKWKFWVHLKVAETLTAQQALRKALEEYRHSLKFLQYVQGEHLALDRADPIELHRKIGYLLESIGEAKKASNEYKQSLIIAQRAAEQDPKDEWKHHLVYAIHFDISRAFLLDNQPDLALVELKKGLKIINKIIEQDKIISKEYIEFWSYLKKIGIKKPPRSIWLEELSKTYQAICEVQLARGKLGKAYTVLQKAQSINNWLIEQLNNESADIQKIKNSGIQKLRLQNYGLRGEIFIRQNKFDEALDAYNKALGIVNLMVPVHSKDLIWQYYTITIHNAIGKAYAGKNSLDFAAKEFDVAQGIAESLTRSQPLDIQAQHLLIMTNVNRGGLLELRKDLGGAIAIYQTALESTKALADNYPDLEVFHRDLALIKVMLDKNSESSKE